MGRHFWQHTRDPMRSHDALPSTRSNAVFLTSSCPLPSPLPTYAACVHRPPSPRPSAPGASRRGDSPAFTSSWVPYVVFTPMPSLLGESRVTWRCCIVRFCPASDLPALCRSCTTCLGRAWEALSFRPSSVMPIPRRSGAKRGRKNVRISFAVFIAPIALFKTRSIWQVCMFFGSKKF